MGGESAVLRGPKVWIRAVTHPLFECPHLAVHALRVLRDSGLVGRSSQATTAGGLLRGRLRRASRTSPENSAESVRDTDTSPPDRLVDTANIRLRRPVGHETRVRSRDDRRDSTNTCCSTSTWTDWWKRGTTCGYPPTFGTPGQSGCKPGNSSRSQPAHATDAKPQTTNPARVALLA